jgi:hypothetical protein
MNQNTRKICLSDMRISISLDFMCPATFSMNYDQASIFSKTTAHTP